MNSPQQLGTVVMTVGMAGLRQYSGNIQAMFGSSRIGLEQDAGNLAAVLQQFCGNLTAILRQPRGNLAAG
jgi:hypothetical protein